MIHALVFTSTPVGTKGKRAHVFTLFYIMFERDAHVFVSYIPLSFVQQKTYFNHNF